MTMVMWLYVCVYQLLLEAGYVVPPAVRVVAAGGGVCGRSGCLGAGRRPRGGQGRGLVPPSLGGLHVIELILQTHLHQLETTHTHIKTHTS